MLASKRYRTAVAVSGGADSLYTLLRLKEEGCDVLALHGIFLSPETQAEHEKAVAVRAGLSEACARLGVPLHILDCSRAFTGLVIEPFIRSYAAGATPNPCALCNATVKFGLLLQEARRLGADRLATGHYAGLGLDDGRTILLQAVDQGKDQSYFLALVPLEALSGACFPLSDEHKSRVLAELDDAGITPPQPGESQEVCFVPGDDYRAFVPRMAKGLGLSLPGPGRMLLPDDTQVGTHQGLWRYTEGQRRGLGVGWREPLHVLGKELRGNILRVGPKSAMSAGGCLCTDVNLLLPPSLWPERVLVKTRYRETPREAVVDFVYREDLPDSQNCQGLPDMPTLSDISDIPDWPDRSDRPDCAAPFVPGSPPPQPSPYEKSLMRIRFAQPESAVAQGQIAAVYVPAPPHISQDRLRLVAGGVICGVLS